MTRHLTALLAFAILMMTACQKSELADLPSPGNANEQTAAVAAAAVKGTVSAEHWKGRYDYLYDNQGVMITTDPDDPKNTVQDTFFIHNGVASLPDIRDGNIGSFFSYIEFPIPNTYHISGDSMILESSVQNLRSNSVSDYDVVLELQGSQHNMQVHFVADSAYMASTSYSLGTITKINLPALVHYFGTFQSIKLATKKGQTAVYINNKLLYRFNYNTDNTIGDIRGISLSGKGVPAFDYVKLTNSVTNKKKMTEDFNTEGQSHTIFY